MMKRKFRILNVDDNEAGRYMVSRQLRHAGFEVIEAMNGQEAIESLKYEPDVIILDVKLPDIDGFEVCRKIKADPQTSSIIVIHLSANIISSQAKAYGLARGADAYLVEPIDASELIATVQAMIRIKTAEENSRNLAKELEKKADELKSKLQSRAAR